MLSHEKLQDESSTPSGDLEAKANLEQCLTALDQEGEPGLQRELERVHPNQGRFRVPMRNFPASHFLVDYDHPVNPGRSSAPQPTKK